jgi:polygalacturonase/pectin methylesterase-like acyl-CoA thioesterase
MKRITIYLGITLAMLFHHCQAALLIREGLNYSTGSIIGQTVNGTGLNGSSTWSKAAGSGTSFTVQSSSLSFAGHFAPSGGSLLISNPSGPYADDSASVAVNTTLTGFSTLYASSIMTMNTSGTYYNDWVIEQRFNSSATGNYASSSGRNIVSAYGSGSSANRKGGVSADSGEVIQSTGSLTAGTKYLLVTKYFVSGANITGATLYVFSEAAYTNYLANSTVGTADANLATYALFSLTDSATVPLSNFGFLQFSISGGPAGQVDEFRLGTAITDVINLTSAPVISGLTDQAVTVGNNVTLSPTVSGTAPISYQWRLNGTNLPMETNAALSLLNVQTNQSGYVYSLVASNAYGAVTNSMTLTVSAAPSFVPMTLNLDINTSSGNNYSGTAIAPGSGMFWNSFLVPAAPSLTLTGVRDSSNNVTMASITISNNNGANFSSWDNSGGGGNPNPLALMRDYLFGGPYTVTISNLPAGIYDLYVYAHGDNTGQASAVTIDAANGGVSGTTTDTGEYRNIYQTGAEGNSYLRLPGVVGSSGVFTFTAIYLNGFQLKSACNVNPITASPTNVTASVGDTVNFAVSTTGTGLTYQWRKNGITLVNSGNISGVQSNVLTISSVALSDIALTPGYDCLVGTSEGCSVISASAKLFVYSTSLSATPLSPGNGVTGICRDTVLRLNFNQPPTVNSAGKIRIYDTLSPSVPADQIDLSQNVNGSQSRTIAGSSFNAYPVIISSNTATIFPNLNMLKANRTYYVTIDPGTFSDTNGALFAGLTNTTAWQFTTKVTGPSNSTNLIVVANGSGDFCTVQGALDYLPANNTQPVVINVRNGEYTEIVNVNNKHNLAFTGENRALTRIGYPNNNGLNPGAPQRSAFILNGNDCTLQNLTLTNMSPVGAGQAEAVDVEGTRAIFFNMELDSHQDTFLVHSSGKLVYFQDSLVAGDTDFNWGYGTVYFTNCEMRSYGAQVTQPRNPLGQRGFGFYNCRITKANAGVSSIGLGRTFGNAYCQALFANCLMDDVVTGFGDASSTNMTDYACSNLTGMASKTLANSVHLTASDSNVIAVRSASIWLYGWQPLAAPVILTNPTSQTVVTGATVVVTISATGIPVPSYQWRKNGTNLFGQNGASLTIANVQLADEAAYSVVVSNASGTVTSSNAILNVLSVNAPSGLSAVPGTNRVTLTWPAVSGATNYNVKRSLTSGGPYVIIANTSSTNYTDTAVSGGMTYYYVVSALGGGDESFDSSEVSALVPAAGALVPWSLSINMGNVRSITDYGADQGNADNGAYVQNAINAAAAGGLTNGLRGGMVRISAGTYLCGPLSMKSNVRLQLDAGVVLRLLDYNSYPGSPTNVTPFINAPNLTNVAVTGLGMIDGQGSPWWPGYKTNSRPQILNFSGCSKALFQDFTISNPPTSHIGVKSANAGNINFIGIRLLAPPSDDPVNASHNTDGVDLAETNVLFLGCIISTGDDNIAMGSSASVTKDVLITNCFFGEGHGCAIGSYTSGGVSNITVASCVFSNTGSGIRIKSARDRGGLVRNLNYYNLTMTNVGAVVSILSYYEFGLGTLNALTPQFVADFGFNDPNPVPYSPPIFTGITISNVNASLSTDGPGPLLLLGLPDYPISNITFRAMNLKTSSTYKPQIYNTTNLQFIDCSWNLSPLSRIQCWNTSISFTNSSLSTNLLLLDGLTTNNIGSTFELHNAIASLSNTNAIASGAITLDNSTLTVSNNLQPTGSYPFNFIVGTNPALLVVKGNLVIDQFAVSAKANISAGPGFTTGTYTLMTNTGALSGAPFIGTKPAGYQCFLSNATAHQINLIVLPPSPGTPTNLNATATNLLINLNWSTSSNTVGFNLKRSTTNGGPYALLASLTTTNYADAAVMPGTNYFYVVTATNAADESGNSIQANAAPLPSNLPTNIVVQLNNSQMQLSWPQDHLGWRLLVQTNSLNSGLGTNWFTVPNSTNSTSASFNIDPANGSMFLRLIYP